MPNAPLIPFNWSSFPDEFRERLGANVGRQRTMVANDQLLVVAHQLPKIDENERFGVLFWLDSQGEWKASNGEPGKIALKQHLDRFGARLDLLEGAVDKAVQANDYLAILDELAPLVRTTKNLLATLEEARKAFPKERSLIDHRDRAYDLSRQADLLYEDAKNSMDVAMIRRADEQAAATKRMAVAAHRLNILAAIFFPLATLGAVFGTTLTDNWSWSHTPAAFVLFLFVGAALGLLLAGYVSFSSEVLSFGASPSHAGRGEAKRSGREA